MYKYLVQKEMGSFRWNPKRVHERRQFNGYSDCLRAGRFKFDSRQMHEVILISIVSRLALGPTQPYS
jgi:hypothetical protein